MLNADIKSYSDSDLKLDQIGLQVGKRKLNQCPFLETVGHYNSNLGKRRSDEDNRNEWEVCRTGR